MSGNQWMAAHGPMLFATLFALSLYRVVYVLGQWGAARMTGVRVCELALGCGPVLWGRKRGDTR